MSETPSTLTPAALAAVQAAIEAGQAQWATDGGVQKVVFTVGGFDTWYQTLAGGGS